MGGTLALPTIAARGTQPPDWTQIVSLAGNQNNWDPSGIGKDLGGVLATVTTSGGIDLTGIIAPNITRPDGTSLFELNLIGASEKVTIKIEDVLSTATNRIINPISGGPDAIVYPGQVARFVYFLPAARWLILSIDYPLAQVGFSSRVDNTTSPVEINSAISHGGLVTNKGRTGVQLLSLPNGPFHNFEVTVQRTERGAGETLALKPQGSDVINHPSGDITSAGTIDFEAGEALTLVYDKVNLTWNLRGESKAAAGGGGGAMQFVSMTEITGAPASNLDITGLDSTVKTWILRVFIEATADGVVQLVLGLIAAFKATGYRLHNHQGQDNSATYIAQVGTSDNQFVIGQNQAESTVTSPHRFTFTIYDPGETDRRKFCEWNGVMLNNSARGDAFWGGGVSDVDDTAFDTVRVRIAGTTLAIGTKALLYKLAEA